MTLLTTPSLRRLQSGLDTLCQGLVDRRQWAVAVLVCGLAVASWHAIAVWQDSSALQREYDQAMDELERAEAQVAHARRLSSASATAQGATSLVAMLSTMEDAWREDIALLQWRADVGHGRATAVFRATSVQAAFGLVERLHSHGARHARLLRQQASERPDGRWRIDATVMVEW